MFDPKKPVQTRSGLKARIIAVDRLDSKFPIVALVTPSATSGEGVNCYSKDGTWAGGEFGPDLDLVNIPETRWVNLYHTGGGGVQAGGPHMTSTIACKHIERGIKKIGPFITTVEIPWE